MLPNIMNMAPMAPVMTPSAANLGVATPQSGTVGFDFNTYLLGLQNQTLVDGGVDWKALLSSTELVSGQQAVGAEKDTSTDSMSALAGLFNLPANTIDTNTNKTALDVLAQQQLDGVETRSVDWKALGMTKVATGEIQEQSWDMQKVEKLFSSRPEDLKEVTHQAKTEKAMEALPGVKVLNVESHGEKVHAFRNEALTADQPIVKLAERMEKPAEKAIPTVSMQTDQVKAGPTLAEPVKTLGKETKTKAVADDSLFASAGFGPSIQNAKGESLSVQTTVVTAPTAPAKAPEWVSHTESLARQGGGKMTIALTPPELGKVEIEVVTRGKNVQVEMRSENEGARKALEGGLSDLKSALLGQDLFLQKSDVKVASSDRSLMDGFSSQSFHNNHSQHQQASQERQSHGNPFSERVARWESSMPSMKVDADTLTSNRYAPGSTGRVDVRI